MPSPVPAGRVQAHLDATPMLDVLLVLIIIFMFAVTKQTLIDAQLPEPARGEPGPEVVAIVLEVGRGGTYRVNRRPVPRPALADELRAIYVARPDKRLLVRGAPDATYQDVVTAMDVARGAGVKVIGLDRAP